MEDLKKFEEKNKESILKVLWGQLRLWLEDLMRTIWIGSKSENKWKSSKQITTDMDRQENRMIKNRK